jgi:hypothetical protein
MTRSALVVTVPEAEAVVGGHRAVLDAVAARGVPAHVSVLVPFVEPELIDGAVLAAVREAVGAVPRFSAELVRVGWFGDRVVFLVPEPGERFRELTAGLWARFPRCPPYGGEFAEVVPHLTIGHDVAPVLLRAAAARVEVGLPIRFEVASVRLLVLREGWREEAVFPLADT